MPRSDQLPPDLQELAYRNCVEITHARWRSDVQLLVEPLRRLTGLPGRNTSSGSRAVASKLSDVPQAESPVPLTETATPLTTSSRIDAATLQRVSRELAHHIGPIADLVVKRAAPHCASADELYLKVAEEIESKGAREEFLKRLDLGLTSFSKIPESTRLPEPDSKAPEPALSQPAIDTRRDPRPAQPQSNSNQSKYLLMIGAAVLVVLIVVGKHFISARPDSGAADSTAKQRSQTSRASSPPALPAEAAPSQSSPPGAQETPVKNVASAPTPSTIENKPLPLARIHVSEEVLQGLLVTQSVPTYPPLARQAHVQGMVVLLSLIHI